MPALCSGLSLRSSPEHSASPSLYLVQQAATDGPELTATSGPRLLAKLNNVFVERIWKSIKYEEVYLHAYASVSEARTSIGRYLEFYNSIRPHSSLDGFTPDQVYFNRLPEFMAA